MDNKDKKKFLEHLSNSEIFSKALSGVDDDEQRRKIKMFAEEFYLSMVEGLMTAKKIVEENPEKVAEVSEKGIRKD